MAQQSQRLFLALWVAIRSLEERGELMHQMATKAHEGDRKLSAKRYEAMALEAQQRADLIRDTQVDTSWATEIANRLTTVALKPVKDGEGLQSL